MTAEPGQPRSLRPEGNEPSATYPTTLRRLTRRQAEGSRDDLADLYMKSCATAPGGEYRSRGVFLRHLADDFRQPDFAILVALAPALTGYACGFPVRRDGSWWSGFRGALPGEVGQLTASGQVFAISGIVVHPSERNHRPAGGLQEQLFADHPALLGATLADRTNRAACAGFRSWGWRDIGVVCRPPGPTVLRALVLPLGRRTAAQTVGPTHHAWFSGRRRSRRDVRAQGSWDESWAGRCAQ